MTSGPTHKTQQKVKSSNDIEVTTVLHSNYYIHHKNSRAHTSFHFQVYTSNSSRQQMSGTRKLAITLFKLW